MMPVYSESLKSYTSPSGNTQILLYRRKKNISERKIKIRKQKFLGLALLIIGIVGCFLLPEDCGGSVVLGLLGIARLVCN